MSSNEHLIKTTHEWLGNGAIHPADKAVIETLLEALEVAERKMAQIAALKPHFMTTVHRGYTVEEFSRPLIEGNEIKAILNDETDRN